VAAAAVARNQALGAVSTRPGVRPLRLLTSSTSSFNAGLADPGLKARLAGLGGTVLAGSPAELGNLTADETEKWAKVIRAANIKAQ
jgi:hypothetical protein